MTPRYTAVVVQIQSLLTVSLMLGTVFGLPTVANASIFTTANNEIKIKDCTYKF